MLVEVAKAADIAPGGMKFVKIGDQELVVCNCDGHFYALARRCGHMNAPLELGALDGTFLTCPLHHVQFDVTTGQALNQPIPEFIDQPLPPKWAQYTNYVGMLMQNIRVSNIRTFPVQVEADAIKVEL